MSAQEGIQGFNLGLIKGAELEQDRIIKILVENTSISPRFDADLIIEMIKGE